jgi:alpha-L-glutamate ligase-like protein
MLNFGILGINARNILYVKKLNDRKSIRLADNKLDTKVFLSERGIPVGETYAVIRSRKELASFRFESIASADFVIKPNRGSKGEGIMIVSRVADGYFRVSGETLDEPTMRRRMMDILDGQFSLSGSSDSILIEEKLVPGETFAAFCRYGLADIRIIVYGLVPVASMVRVPTALSGGKANIAQGGIGMGIDTATGEVVSMFADRTGYSRAFPEPYEDFRGLEIPYWDDILLASAKTQFFVNLGYLALDWVITDSGPRLLEINARAGLEVQNVTLVPLRTRLDKLANLDTNDPEKGVEIAKALFGRHKTAMTVKESQILYLSQPGTLSILDEEGSKNSKAVEVIVDTTIDHNELSADLSVLADGSDTLLEIEDSPVRFESLRYSTREEDGENRVFLGRRSVADFFVKPMAKTKSRGKGIFGVPTSEWPTILRLDKDLYDIGKKLNFSKIFRPLNQIGELDRFASERGRYDPVFVYDFPDRKYTDGLRIRLDELAKRSDPRDFQTGAIALYHEKIEELRVKCAIVDAYREDDYESVAELDEALYGGLDPEAIEESVGKIFHQNAGASKEDLLGPILGKSRIEALLHENLERIGLRDVAIEWGDSGLSRVAVSYGRFPKIRLSEHAVIRERELLSIFAHEVETHLVRGVRGEESGLALLKYGTGFYLAHEEGLAIWNSFRALPE